MKKTLLTIFSLLSIVVSAQQVQIWSDDFDTSGDWNLSDLTGQNDSDANLWVISDEEGGVAPPNCGVAGNGDPTLHISCQGAACPGTGAIYNAGDNGLGIAPSTTNIRAFLTNSISTVGETNLELVFDWIGVGQAGADFAELEYSVDGGTTWNVLWTQAPGNVCGGGQGEWADETVALPVAAENQADLRFAFHWRNDNDGSGSDPSFAANNLRLFAASATGPTASFTPSSTNLCEGDCISFADNSTGNAISTWNWTFDGSSTASSMDQNPTNICFPTAGTYDVTLEVTDADGTDVVTESITVASCTNAPTAAFTTDTLFICKGDCISFTDESTGEPTSWNWTFDGADPSSSTLQNPSSICYDTTGTFDVTLVVSNDGGSDQIISSITVLELPEIQGFGDTIIDIGGAAVLEAYATNMGVIFWEPNDDIICDTITCNIVTASPLLTETYYPSVEGANGCIGRDTIQVIVNFEEIVEVPSAFSPNGDGMNDLLHVLGLGIVNVDFKIYNRYGQLVFESTDLEEGWDGTFQGEELNQGVFVYTVNYDLINGQSGEISGNVTLVK